MTPRAVVLVLVAVGALAAPTSALAAPCPPEQTGQMRIAAPHEFVSTRSDNGFGAE